MSKKFEDISLDNFTNKSIKVEELDFNSVMMAFSNSRLYSLGLFKLVAIMSAMNDKILELDSDIQSLKELISNNEPSNSEVEQPKTINAEVSKGKLKITRNKKRKV